MGEEYDKWATDDGDETKLNSNLYCQQCDIYLRKMSEFKQHMEEHKVKLSWELFCYQCRRFHRTRGELKQHMEEH